MGTQQRFLVTMGTLLAWQLGSHNERQPGAGGMEVVGSSPVEGGRGKHPSFLLKKDALAPWRSQEEATDEFKPHSIIQFRRGRAKAKMGPRT